MSKELYSRHILLKEILSSGQEKIAETKILLIGVGGIGCTVAMNLVLAGVKKLTIYDYDLIEESNLARQILFNYSDIGANKASIAKQKLQILNDDVTVTAIAEKFKSNSVSDMVEDYDYIIDATDDIKTKYLLNQFAINKNKVFASGSFLGWQGYYTIYKAGIAQDLPCFACFHGENLDLQQERACYNQGVIAAGVQALANMLVVEIIKDITNSYKTIAGNLMIIDFLTNKHRLVTLKKNPNCKICN